MKLELRLLKHSKKIFLLLFLFVSLVAYSQWINTGVEGVFNVSLGISPIDSDFILTGGDIKGGIYRSLDAGENWEYVGMHMQQVLCFGFNYTDINIAYAGSSNGLLKTTDKGLTWERIAFQDTIIHSLACDPNNANVIYIGTGSLAWDGTGYGVFKSIDGGLSFTQIGLSPNLMTEIIISQEDSQKVIASCGSGVFYTENGGVDWELLGPIKDAVPGVPTAAIAWNGADSIYACAFYQAENYYLDGTLYLTTDGGVTWDSLRSFQSNIEAIRIDPFNASKIYVAVFESCVITPGVYFSDDSGDNWIYRSAGINDLMLKDLAIDPNNPSILYTTGDGGGGIYKSSDEGQSWTQKNYGLNYYISFRTKHLSVDDYEYIYTINSFGVYKDVPQMARMNVQNGVWDYLGIMSMETATNEHTMLSLFDFEQDPVNDNLIYACGMAHSGGLHDYPSEGVFYESNDAGVNWLPSVNFDFRTVNCLELLYDEDQQIILAGTGGASPDSTYGIWLSEDGGLSFGMTSIWYPGVQIMDIKVDPFDDSKVYAATTIGMFISEDKGYNWSLSPLWDAENYKLTYRITTDENESCRLFTANGGWLINTDDNTYGGISWSDDCWQSREDAWLHDNAMEFAICGDLLFVGIGGQYTITSRDTITGKGVWYTNINDEEYNWQALDTAGMERKFILSLECHDSILYAGTLGGGLWKYDLHDLLTKDKDVAMNDNKLFLWPNPASENVFLRINDSEIICEKELKITVYSQSGVVVETFLVNSDSLYNGVLLNTQNLSSGTYSLSISSKNFNYNSRLIIVK
ncbi:MAG: hypothetical protein C0596_01245 [Marinilabiliales bacterium]|nr:MAG: hypothetical protein C0596_01245 [Marinilabiliales bacterium]